MPSLLPNDGFKALKNSLTSHNVSFFYFHLTLTVLELFKVGHIQKVNLEIEAGAL